MRTINTYICATCNKLFQTYSKNSYYCNKCSGDPLEIDKLPKKQFRRSVESWNKYADETMAKILRRAAQDSPQQVLDEKPYKLPYNDESLNKRITIR